MHRTNHPQTPDEQACPRCQGFLVVECFHEETRGGFEDLRGTRCVNCGHRDGRGFGQFLHPPHSVTGKGHAHSYGPRTINFKPPKE